MAPHDVAERGRGTAAGGHGTTTQLRPHIIERLTILLGLGLPIRELLDQIVLAGGGQTGPQNLPEKG